MFAFLLHMRSGSVGGDHGGPHRFSQTWDMLRIVEAWWRPIVDKMLRPFSYAARCGSSATGCSPSREKLVKKWLHIIICTISEGPTRSSFRSSTETRMPYGNLCHPENIHSILRFFCAADRGNQPANKCRSETSGCYFSAQLLCWHAPVP